METNDSGEKDSCLVVNIVYHKREKRGCQWIFPTQHGLFYEQESSDEAKAYSEEMKPKTTHPSLSLYYDAPFFICYFADRVVDGREVGGGKGRK